MKYFIFLFVFCSLNAIPLSSVKEYADGLNQEGALLWKRRPFQEQLWANVAFVLDRPFEAGIDHEELTAANPYPLKEASLLEYNEKRAALIQILLLRYYISQEIPTIIVNVHRESSGPKHVEQLKKLIETCLEDFHPIETSPHTFYFEEKNATAFLQNGTEVSPCEADLVLSISLVAGFHPDYQEGTILLPERFIPFDPYNGILAKSLAYEAENHILKIVPQLLEQQTPDLLEKVDHIVISPNPNKKELLRPLKEKDLIPCTLLQSSRMFNPKKHYDHLEVI